MPEWSAEQYSKFEKERTLPAVDLADSIRVNDPEKIIDIGCGIGNSTAVLRKKYPKAQIVGADSSEDMLNTARKNYPEIEFIKLDVATELASLSSDFDIVFSNACIQWIPDHRELLKSLMTLLRPGGVLAVQIPRQKKHPMHGIINAVAGSEKWRYKIKNMRASNILTEEEYYDILSELSSDFRIWETTYFHDMPSHDSIIEWYKGTGLRPYLEQLNDTDKNSFEYDVLQETKKQYPLQRNGHIIFRFPRLFFLCRKTVIRIIDL